MFRQQRKVFEEWRAMEVRMTVRVFGWFFKQKYSECVRACVCVRVCMCLCINKCGKSKQCYDYRMYNTISCIDDVSKVHELKI